MKVTRKVIVVLSLVASCSGRNPAHVDGGGDGQVGREGGPIGDVYLPDVVRVPDGFGPLAPCSPPGTSCKPNNPCAINPICGADLLCHPTGIQRCDDGLACTVDSCKGQGLCENMPKTGTCALVDPSGPTIVVACFKDGDVRADSPCMVCDSKSDPFKWSSKNGGACDDGKACTKDDYCQAGACKGTYYGDQCADNLACTEDLCDGAGGCLGNTLLGGWCLINGACHKDGDNDPAGTCNKCEVTKSVSAWMPITDACQISTGPVPPPPFPPPPPGPTTCYANGDPHPSGSCAACDTAASKTAWTVKSGCLIYDTCYLAGAKDSSGCNQCDPATSTSSWTPLGGLCSINGGCYNPGDKSKDGCGTCDPTKSQTAWTPVANVCLIDGLCYKSQDPHPGGCAQCVPTTSATSWTVVGSYCLVDGVCRNPGDASASGCGTCDPTKSKTAWTPKPSTCLIGGTCYNDGDLHSSGCLKCVYAQSPTAWTPISGVSVVSQGFDSGAATGWTLANTDPSVGWIVSGKRTASGSHALYYGDPVLGNYEGAGQNSGSATMGAITLTAGKKAALSFQLWMDTESGPTYDRLRVFVGSTVVWEKDVTQQVTMQQWQSVDVNLGAYAGQQVTIRFELDTVDSVANDGEGVYIDSVTVYHGC